MANAKKTTVSKPKSSAAKTKKPTATTKRVTTTAKPVANHKTTPKKTSAKKVSTSSEFMTMQPTRETAYWLIFSLLILALGIWVLTLTIQINDIYDQIDRNNSTVSSLDNKAAALKQHKMIEKAD